MSRILLTAACLTALVLSPMAAQAKPKPCPKLCRADLKTCRANCQNGDGSRKEKKACKRGCKIGLNAICRSFAEPLACLPPSGTCGPAPLTCPYLQIAFGLTTGVALPANFPAPPPGAVDCGGLTSSGTAGTVTFVFYSTTLDADALAAYYGPGFSGGGYTFAEAPENVNADRASCDRSFKVTDGGTAVGGLYSFAAEGAFTVVSGSATAPPGKK